MLIFTENGEIYSIAVTCWQGVFTHVLWLWNCDCLKVFVYVFMMWPCGTTSLQYFDKFRSAYVKCIKVFFGYTKFYSVTAMLTELGLQKFDSLIDKCRNDFQRQIYGCDDGIVQHFVYLHLMWLIYVMCDCIAAFFSLTLSVFLPIIFMFLLFYGPSAWNIDWLTDW